ncbi:DUF1707 domain-containing protein [Streptomyces sp. NPDC048389]|uniref:DUF1707 SHOCT-like domain-containing protein n=1 Tax=Streptomyces sp. NPDC048389 TaxID=3154622 RepID=UPI003454972B
MTSELPEMRASDAERERVAERLRDAVAEGRLDMDEFDQRLDAAYRARTHGDLAPLVRDLPAPAGPGAAVAPASGSAPDRGSWSGRVGDPATSKFAFSFWGGFMRRGSWTVGRRFTAFTLMGGGELDLRDAHFEDPVSVIDCVAIMGGIQVTVPPGLNVEVKGIGLMGGFDESGRVEADPDPAAPRVIVRGLALMGGVGVERKLTRAEKQRLKAERERERKLAKGNDRKELGDT